MSVNFNREIVYEHVNTKKGANYFFSYASIFIFMILNNFLSFLDVKPLNDEFRFNVPGENIYFSIKNTSIKFSENYMAILFEQVLIFIYQNTIFLLQYISKNNFKSI